MTNLTRFLVVGCSTVALAACGGEEIASPGTGGNITINNPAPAPAPGPTPTPTTTATAATGCPFVEDPQGLTDRGVISGPTGSYRLCQLPARFNRSSQLQFTPATAAVIYLIDGQVDVGTDGGPAADASDGLSDTNVTLTIDPGVILVGLDGSYLNVNRGNMIMADGTASRPIIFTSQQNVRGENTDASRGDWGGLIINGRAPVTDCLSSTATPGSVNCEREVEGTTTPPRYGGNDASDSSGSVSFVQLRFSGTTLANGDELQSLTTGGTGSGTNFSNIMSFNSDDDGVEFFGGIVNMKNLVVVGATDDSLDTDTGVHANLQYVVAIQSPGIGDTILEGDSNNSVSDDTPRQRTNIVNATLIGNGVELDQVLRLRGEADFSIANSVVVDASAGTPCIRIDLPGTLAAAGSQPDEAGPPTFDSVVLDCPTNFRDGSDGVTAAQAEAAFDAGSNNNKAFTNTLTMTYINGANEDAVTAFAASTISSFFDDAGYIGAAQAGSTRFEGWTCDSATVTFGNNTGLCTSLPVYT